MGAPPQPPADGPIAADQTLSQDTPCRKCGYNLRGLGALGRCPECGTPIGLSLHGRLLRYADPQWVQQLARGVNLILWGLLVTVVISLCMGLLAGAAGLKPGPFQSAIAWIGALLGAWGAWLLTEPDPSGLGEDEYGRIRRITRAAVAIGVLSGLTNVIVQGITFAPVVVVLNVVVAAGGLVGWLGEIFKFWFMEKLAMRIPDEALARRARFLRWALVWIGVLLVVFTATLTLTAWAGGNVAAGPNVPPVASAPAGGSAGVVNVGGNVIRVQGRPGSLLAVLIPLTGCFVVLLILAMLVLTLVAVRMQWRLRNALREQARFARQTWAAAAG